MSKLPIITAKDIKNYVINYLWLGRKNSEDQQPYIHNAKTLEALENNFLEPIVKRALANKEAEVYVWYDSLRNSKEAIENTEKALYEYMKKNNCENVFLRDVRTIPFVNENKHLFSLEGSTYFIVDSLKGLVIPLYWLKKGKMAVIVNDFSVGGLDINFVMDKDYYFNEKSIEQHQKYGIILNKNIASNSKHQANPKYIVENQYIQIINNENIVTTLELLVNANAMRATTIFNMPENAQKALTPTMFYMPYFAIAYEFHSLYTGLSDGTLKIRADALGAGTKDQWIKYDPQKHGLEFSGTHMQPGSSKQDVKYLIEIDGKMFNRDEIVAGMDVHPPIDEVTRETNTRPGNPHLTESAILPQENYQCKFWSECNIEPVEAKEENDQQLISSQYNVELFVEEKETDENLDNTQVNSMSSEEVDVMGDAH